ncbi:hypothetical protein D3C86_1854760 [compost metagenome]
MPCEMPSGDVTRITTGLLPSDKATWLELVPLKVTVAPGAEGVARISAAATGVLSDGE